MSDSSATRRARAQKCAEAVQEWMAAFVDDAAKRRIVEAARVMESVFHELQLPTEDRPEAVHGSDVEEEEQEQTRLNQQVKDLQTAIRMRQAQLDQLQGQYRALTRRCYR